VPSAIIIERHIEPSDTKDEHTKETPNDRRKWMADSMLKMFIVDNITVFWTTSIQETAKLLVRFAELLNEGLGLTHTRVGFRWAKRSEEVQRNHMAHVLEVVDGMSLVKAKAIQKMYPSPASLILAFLNVEDESRPFLLSKIQAREEIEPRTRALDGDPPKDYSIGPSLSAKVYRKWFNLPEPEPKGNGKRKADSDDE